MPETAFGLRLIILAVASACFVFLPLSVGDERLVAGIAAGVALGLAQFLAMRRGVPVAAGCFVIAQLGVWTYLVCESGGPRSPLLIGYLLEIPLVGLVSGPHGAILAAVATAIAILAVPALSRLPFSGSIAMAALGLLAVVTALTVWVIETIDCQRRELDRMHAALRARTESVTGELRLLGDYLSGGLVALDELGRVATINPAGEAILGIEPASAIGRPWQEVLRIDNTGARAITRTLDTGHGERGQRWVLQTHCGRPLSVEAGVWMAPTPAGRRTSILFIPTLAHEDEGADPLRRLGEAVACVSHQFKNSLHALEGFARELDAERRGRGDAGSESSHQLIHALRTLAELADDVLAMSGAPRPPEDLRLVDAVSSAVALARWPSVRICLEAAAGDLRVRCHRGALVHALFNLIDNACRVSPAGAEVRIRAQAGAERAVIEIIDRGPGIPVGLEGSGSPVPSGSGSGYGILAARRFLGAFGADLVFERTPTGDTACRVLLPLAAAKAKA